MSLLAVTVLGHDRPGIIADVTGAVAGLGGNLEDSSMTLLRGHFAWTLIADLDAGADLVAQRLSPLAEEGLVVSVLPLPVEPEHAAAGASYLLSVHGSDRPGIVSQLTRVLADAGGNVTDLTTRLAGGMYVLLAEVDVPADADLPALQARVAGVARGLGVEAGLRPTEPDVL
jgi:glycine cleavage system transcriptional repressor